MSGKDVSRSDMSGNFQNLDSELESCVKDGHNSRYDVAMGYEKYICKIPRIVLISGQDESSVKFMLDSLKNKPIEKKEIDSLHTMFEKEIAGHTIRGFTILDTTIQDQTAVISESTSYYSGMRRPLWYVFNGIDSNWTGIGADLMRIPVFANAIERCHKVLEPKGIDIVKTISEPNKTIFDNILNAFVGIGALQIGLTDIFKGMGVQPDYIIDLSERKLACAYHDNTITAEQFILASYDQGKAALESKSHKGNLAAVALENKTNQVLLEEAIRMIPSNAVVVKIFSDDLFEAILKKSLPGCTYIPLARKDCQSRVKFMLDGIGKLYLAGYNPKVDVLYTKNEFLVSTKTSHLTHFKQSENRPAVENVIEEKGNKTVSWRDIIISVHDDDYTYITNHVVNGVPSVPEAALLVYVWKTIAIDRKNDFRKLSIILKNIKFHKEVFVNPEAPVRLSVMTNQVNDKFEIYQDSTMIVSGIASDVQPIKFLHTIDSQDDDFDDIILNSEDIYKMFRIRGYSYGGALKSIHTLNSKNHNAFIKWKDDWISFLDSLIQLNNFTRNHNGVSKPTYIRKLSVCVLNHENFKPLLVDEVYCHAAKLDKALSITRCAGVEIDTITYEDKPVVNNEPDVLRTRTFFPYFATDEVDIKMAVEINIQVIAENAYSRNIRILKSVTLNTSEVFDDVKKIFDFLPQYTFDVKYDCSEDYLNDNLRQKSLKHTNVFIIENLLDDIQRIKTYHSNASYDDFILTLESGVPKQPGIKEYFNILTCMSNGKNILMLMRKRNNKNNITCYPVTMEHTFSWILRVGGEIMTTKHIVLVSERQAYSGLLGYIKKIRKEGYKNVSLVSILDFHAQSFDPNNDFYKDQIEKKMSVNVLKKGQFGGYYYTSCATKIKLRSFTLKSMHPGDINKLAWVEAPSRLAKNTLVQVSFSGLSRYDYHKAINCYTSNGDSLGMDFSGIDKNGDRVMGLIRSGAMSSTIEADPDLLWTVPDHWSLEDAATVPLPYVQAYYCLVLKGHISKRQRVLINSNEEAFGQAVIAICLALDCTVFITCTDWENKENLMRIFTQSNGNNIYFCEFDNLYSMVMKNTEKKGCDLVINFATGSDREAVMKCVGNQGIFLNVCKHDIFENNDTDMSYLNEDKSFKTVNILNIFKPECGNEKNILRHCVAEGISQGIVKPIARVVCIPNVVSSAFGLLSTRKNKGRVLIRLRDSVIMNQGLEVLPRLTYAPQEVVVIVCDGKSLGVELAEKIVDRGAKKIIVHMKPKLLSGYEHSKFLSWSKREVSVKLCTENLHSMEGCESLVKKAMKFGKVKEVFIIQDGKRDDDSDKDDFINVFNEKCLVVLNLDTATRYCTELRYFTIVGHSVQNMSDEYALSLSERVCEQRNEMGLPALLIRCESLTELCEQNVPCNIIETQSLSTFFNALETSLRLKYRNVFTFNTKKENNAGLHKKIQ